MELEASAENLFFTTVRINFKIGHFRGFGTSFYVKNGGRVFLMSNRHVLQPSGCTSLSCSVRISSTEHSFVREFNLDQNKVIAHNNSNIDLAVVEITDMLDKNKEIIHAPITKHLIPTSFHKVKPITPILMVGYPNGVMDKANGSPIARFGITATDIRSDFEGSPSFVVDVATYQGSSGSPVFLLDRETLLFLGVQYSAFTQNLEANIQYRHNTVTAPTHLSKVVRSSECASLLEDCSAQVN